MNHVLSVVEAMVTLRGFALVVLSCGFAWAPLADEGEGLMPFAPKVHRVVQDGDLPDILSTKLFSRTRQQLLNNFIHQSPVKSQGSRGTCSIFATLAAVEWFLNKKHGETKFDLSEQYLNFAVKTQVSPAADDGSNSGINQRAVRNFGVLEESAMPYSTRDWTKNPLDADLKPQVDETCGAYNGFRLGQCKVVQRSPNDKSSFPRAKELGKHLGTDRLAVELVWRESEIQRLIDQGGILLLEMEFFYRAWAHSRTTEYGLGVRDFARFNRGEVLTPDDEDIKLSRRKPAGHAVVLVGYDREKRVYHFKNSWGSSDFGRDSNILDNAQHTGGYGTITFDYAHNYGSFYRLDDR